MKTQGDDRGSHDVLPLRRGDIVASHSGPGRRGFNADFHGQKNNQRFSTEKPGNSEKTWLGTGKTLIVFGQLFAHCIIGLFVDEMRRLLARPTQCLEK
jgi:hypothetical protein